MSDMRSETPVPRLRFRRAMVCGPEGLTGFMDPVPPGRIMACMSPIDDCCAKVTDL